MDWSEEDDLGGMEVSKGAGQSRESRGVDRAVKQANHWVADKISTMQMRVHRDTHGENHKWPRVNVKSGGKNIKAKMCRWIHMAIY